MPATPFRVAIVSGVNPGKWTKAWADRRTEPIEVTPIDVADQRAVLLDGQADLVFVRLPIDRERLNVIRLYEETPVVVAPKDHPISVFESVTLADLASETVRTEPLEDAIDLVVAGAGILLLPQSIARQHARRDLAVRPVTDAPATEIAIAWLNDHAPENHVSESIEEFVGIVRGRTAASSRGAAAEPASQPKPRKSPARTAAKTAAKPSSRRPRRR